MKGKPFIVHMHCTQSLHEHATLRKRLEGWRGRRFDQAELQNYDPRKLLGTPCRLSLVEGNGGYTNVDGISPVTRKEAEAMPGLQNKKVYFSLEEDQFSEEVFALLSDKTKETIQKSPEYWELREAKESEPDDDAAQPDYSEIPF